MKKAKTMLILFIIITLIIITTAVLISMMAQFGEIFGFAGLCLSLFLLILLAACLEGYM